MLSLALLSSVAVPLVATVLGIIILVVLLLLLSALLLGPGVPTSTCPCSLGPDVLNYSVHAQASKLLLHQHNQGRR